MSYKCLALNKTIPLVCVLIMALVMPTRATFAYTNDQDTSNQMVALFSAIEQKKQAEKDRQSIDAARQQIEYESAGEMARLDGDYQRGMVSPDSYYQTRALILQNRQFRLTNLADTIQNAQYQQAQVQQAAVQNQLYAVQIRSQQIASANAANAAQAASFNNMRRSYAQNSSSNVGGAYNYYDAQGRKVGSARQSNGSWEDDTSIPTIQY